MFTVDAGTAKETVGQVVDLTIAEFRALRNRPSPRRTSPRQKSTSRARSCSLFESTSSRMSNLARQELYFGRFFTLDEILASIEAVTRGGRPIPRPGLLPPEQISATVLGPLNGFTSTAPASLLRFFMGEVSFPH